MFPYLINILGLEHQSISCEVYSNVFILKDACCIGSWGSVLAISKTGRSGWYARIRAIHLFVTRIAADGIDDGDADDINETFWGG